MQKLTREQAEWLIQNILKSRAEQLFGRNAYHEEVVLKVINQCTAKEFPYFNFAKVDIGSIELNGSIHRPEHITIGMQYNNVTGIIACMDLSHDEFKEFTAACQRICEWIDENS